MSGLTESRPRATFRRLIAKPEIVDEAGLRRAQRVRRVQVIVVRLLLIAAVLGSWELMSGRFVDEFWISRPSAIGERFYEWTLDGTIWHNLSYTLQSTAYGYLIGAGSGVILGLLLGRIVFLADVLDPIILALYSLPRIALAPLFVLWLGIGLYSKIVIVAIVVFFLVFYNTYRGVREVDTDLVDVVRIMGGRRWRVINEVVIPSSAVWIFTGLRISIPHALTGAVVGEIVASTRGVGHMLKTSANTFDTTGEFVMLGVLMIVAGLIFIGVNRIENRTSRWNANYIRE